MAYVEDTTRRYLPGTMQAEAIERQFGYSGDFQIINHIYTRHITTEPH